MSFTKMIIQNVFGEDVVEAVDSDKPSRSGARSGTKSPAKKKVLSCDNCSLNGTLRIEGSFLNTKASVLVLGESPELEDITKGKLFAGKYGSLVREYLLEAGFSFEDVQFAMICKCPTFGKVSGVWEYRQLTDSEVKTCSTLYLNQEIARFDKCIALGKTAWELLAQCSDSWIRGNIIKTESKRVGVTYGPTFAAKSPSLLKAFANDLAFFKSVFIDGHTPKFTIVDSVEKQADCLESALQSETLVLDFETTGVDLNSTITMAGFRTNGGVYVIPTIGRYQNNFSFLKRMMNIKDATYVAHNASFEYRVAKHHGLLDDKKIKMHDTMIFEHLLDSRRKKGDLDLATVAVSKGHRWSTLRLNPADISDFPALMTYNAEDVINTGLVYDQQKKQLKALGSWEVGVNTISPAINPLSDMEYNGILLDIPAMHELKEKLEGEIEEINKDLTLKFGERNWGSSDQLQDVLVGLVPGAVLRKTDTGKISTDEESLKIYFDYGTEHNATENGKRLESLCTSLLTLREKSKLLSTYIVGLLAKADSNGRLRGRFWLTGTETGRLSSSGPNLQNIPRDKTVKNVFIATEGWTLVEVDAAQIELRIAAVIAPDYVMTEAYKTGIDIHTLTASAMMGVDPSKVSEEARSKAKPVNFGLLYGQSWQGLQSYAKNKYSVSLSNEEAQKFREVFFKKYPGLQIWHNNVTRSVMSGNDMVRTVFGRTRKLDLQNQGDAVRQALNTPVQSAASDCNLTAMRYLWERLNDDTVCRFLLTVHDQIMFEIKDSYVHLVPQIIADAEAYVMKTCSAWLKVPFILDIKVGKKWGSLQKVKK